MSFGLYFSETLLGDWRFLWIIVVKSGAYGVFALTCLYVFTSYVHVAVPCNSVSVVIFSLSLFMGSSSTYIHKAWLFARLYTAYSVL